MRVRTPSLAAAVLAVSFAGLISAGHPLGLNENHPYGILGTAYVTPHIAWAKPYAGGMTHALVLAPSYSQRETVELAQRLSLGFKAWMTVGFHQAVAVSSDWAAAAFLPPPEAVQRSLCERAAGDYDVIVVGKLLWSIVPAEQRFQLLRKVAEGTGLVYVNPPEGDPELDLVLGRKPVPGGSESIVRHLPLAALPAFRDKDLSRLVRAGRFGKGRVVTLDYQEQPPPEKLGQDCAWPCLTPQWDTTDSREDGFVPLADLPQMQFVPYEYYQALVARAVLWAAHKEPSIELGVISLPTKPEWPVAGTEITVEVTGASRDVRVRAVVRHSQDRGRAVQLKETRAEPTTTLVLPDLPAGEYFLDIWLLQGSGRDVLTWGSRAFTVIADCEVRTLETDGQLIDPGKPVSGSITLSRPLTKGERLEAELWDNYGRMIRTVAVHPQGVRGAFTFTPFAVRTICHRIVARLLRNNRLMVTASHDFPVRARLRWDDFNSVVWSGGENQLVTHLMLHKLAAQDEADSIDIGWRGATVARNIAMANLSHTPYTARYGVFGPCKDNIIRTGKESPAYGCMSDPVALKGLDEWGDAQSRIYGPYGPLAWTHGDETNYAYHSPDVCWSPTCLQAYRQLLRSLYGSVSELNGEWRTDYADFSDVMPITFAEAKASGNYAPWVTHRLSCDRVFSGFYRRSGEALEAHDPGGRGAGFDGGVGLSRPNSGGDWWRLSQDLELLHAYCHDSAQTEVFRSFAHPGQLTGMWYGTYGPTWQIGPSTAEYCHFFPWYSLFHGLNSTWFWTMGAPGYLSGHAPDLTSLPFFEARTTALREIKGGIGKLLLNSLRQNDRIAIHFSETSRIAASLFAAKEADWGAAYAHALADVNKALEDCGFQYEYVSYEEVEQDALLTGGFRLFFMPQSRALSRPETDRIRAFAEQGGVVIADILPGVLNGKGHALPRSSLAEMFASDETGTVTTVGKGKTILIGDTLAGYGKAHMDEIGWRRLQGRWKPFGDLLQREADVAPAVTVVPTGADTMPPTETTRFRAGSSEFVALLREYFLYDGKPYKARVRFPRESHVYDVMAGTYLGWMRSVDTVLSHEARLFWLSPYKVESVHLSLPPTSRVGQPTRVEFGVKTSGGAGPSRHCFRMTVTSPSGRELKYHARNVLTEAGAGSAEVPWALNDPLGRYTVVVADVATGVTAKGETRLR